MSHLQNRLGLTEGEDRLAVAEAGEEVQGEGWSGVGVSTRKLWHSERRNKVLLYSEGNHIQSPGIIMEKNIQKERMRAYNRVTLQDRRGWHSTVNQLHFKCFF